MFEKIDQNKAMLDELYPINDRLLQDIRGYYKASLIYSSNAMEGNSLSESETKILLEERLTVGGKPIRDYQEAIGHAKAFEYVSNLMHWESLHAMQLNHIHRLFYALVDEDWAGRYRQARAGIFGARYPVPLPEQIEPRMKEFFHWLTTQEKQYHPVEFAAKVNKELSFIHPFVDGNGQVARLLMNFCLLRHGYALAIISPELGREYNALLEKAHEDDTGFVAFIVERVAETQQDLLQRLNLQTGSSGASSQTRCW